MNEHTTAYLRYLPLIKSRASKICMRYSFCEVDDAIQEASVALINVVSKYDSTKGRFATLASIAIERHLNKWAGKQARRNYALGGDDWSIVGDDSVSCDDASYLLTDFLCSLDADEFALVSMCLKNWYKNKSMMVADAVKNGIKKSKIEKISVSIRRKMVM